MDHHSVKSSVEASKQVCPEREQGRGCADPNSKPAPGISPSEVSPADVPAEMCVGAKNTKIFSLL
jgi:hypothetical protein